ncbi:hypothetical protein [[Leptolyngbya] sp. PCC 7376]|uniref:hypothetical protein n=1 Tax=[Leptolyngbya] sp. PCC 7376 TaxID=111781 RepID=UPI0005A24604|nr:hypothetical protein [[Leptolyngbya] sp. PCC 7376]
MKLNTPLRRFCLGSAAGLFCGVIAWSYSAFAHVAISPTQGVVGLLFLAISCGAIAGLTDFDHLMEQIPPF